MSGKKHDALGALADATGLAIGGVRKEIGALADAVGEAIAVLHELVGAEIEPALKAAAARASVLSARRSETVSVVSDWLARCASNAA
jgi:hypothetical protein